MSSDGTGIDDQVRVFMSYRRSDDPNFTGRFHDKLTGVFGETNVFRDIDSLAAGTRFAEVITESLDHVDAVVALIGPTWVSRLASPTDFVRMEIGHALRAGKAVVPVLIEETPLPDADALPEELRPLLDINAVRVRRDPDFHRDAARVVAGIRENVHVGREFQARMRREREAAEAERARVEQQAREEAERARDAALRLRLEEELARAEAEEAERRNAADALEHERLERLVVLARLEEEATRRQIADEHVRLAAIVEAKQRRDDEAAAAQARAEELRERLAQPGPLVARRRPTRT